MRSFNLRNTTAAITGKTRDIGLAWALAVSLVQPALPSEAYRPLKLPPELANYTYALLEEPPPTVEHRGSGHHHHAK